LSSFLQTKNPGNKNLFGSSLSKLEEFLSTKIFYRANRQHIISINYIRSFKAFEKVKLQVLMKLHGFETPIIISQATAAHIRKWIQEV
jgi:DNA-binding LytR/AlgR family response regulator